MFDLDRVLAEHSLIGISGHIRPDGDCIGSCLGLYLYIKNYYPEKEVTVYLEEIPEKFSFLAGAKEICHEPEKDKTHDLFFLLDCSEKERIGRFASMFSSAEETACIDHHVTGNPRADYVYVRPEASSTSELICDLTGTQRITPEMARTLYMGIAHDTGVFRYSNTSPRTMALAGALMDKGIDFSRIVEDTYYSKTYRQKQIMGRAMLESIRLFDGRVIFTALHRKDLEFYRVVPSDLEGIVSELAGISGVDAAIFLYETGSRQWKVSLRSSDRVDVSVVAQCFGGGGHKKAAGCSMQGSVHDVVNNLTARIEEQLV